MSDGDSEQLTRQTRADGKLVRSKVVFMIITLNPIMWRTAGSSHLATV